ncbi:hypothetical protein STASHLEY_00260 [Brevundimonas phage vB_BpoS-StAshley]|nr:hypothetical protein STASHLEY_00260 [Brevundimonas phage vB_BpoS-StAshley]UTC30107.1 hypothetical protein MAINES_00680 [Brevundimonas phage vB_BpoS-MaInes]
MIVVHNSRGEIQYTVDDPYVKEIYDTYEAQSDASPDFNYIVTESVSTTNMYVDSEGFLTPKPELFFAVPSVVTVGTEIHGPGLPADVVVWIDGEQVIGALPFVADDPGKYEIVLECWPYVTKYFMLEVIP